MPRIRFYYYLDRETNQDNDPRDYCKLCYPLVARINKDNPMAEVTGDDHPPYDETDYKCYACGKVLSCKDDQPNLNKI